MTSVTYDVYARDRASKTFDSVGHSALGMGNLSKKAALGVAAVGTAVAAVTVAAGVFAYKVGSTYVASLNKIQALTGASNKTMTATAKQLEANAGLYAKMGQTTGDAAGGVVELTKAGLSLHDAMASIVGTMTLAKAGELSVADASTITANALNTFHLSAKKAGDVANYLANAANISSADVSDIAESFKYVAPVAAAAGVSIQQVNAILAELANAGIKGSNAGTGLRKFLLSLQAPSGAAATDLKALNVEIYDANGKMKPLSQVIGILGKSLGGLSQQARNKDLKDIFGLQGIASATTIFKGGTAGLAQYTKGVERAGAAQALANAQSKGLAGTIAMLKATVTSTAQSFYREFSPLVNQALMPLAQWLTKISTQAAPALRQEVQSLQPEFAKLEPKVAALAQEVGHNLYPAFQAALQSLKKNRPEYQAFAASIIKATPPILKLASAITGKVVPPLIRMNDVMSKTPFGTTVKGLTNAANAAGWAAGIYLKMGGALGSARGAEEKFGASVRSTTKSVIGYIGTLPGKIRSAVGNLGSILYNAGVEVVDGLINGIQSKIGALTSKLHDLTHLIPLHKGPIDKDRVLLKPAGVAIMEGLISGIDSQKVSLTRALDAVTNQVQASNAKLKAAVGARNQFAAGFQSFSSSAFGADYGTDDAGNPIAPTATSIIAYQKQQANQAHTVKTDVRKLIKMGLSPALIKQLQSAGASGIAEIQALANATPRQIRQYDALNKETSSDLRDAGMSAGNRLYGREIRQDRRGLHESQELRKAMEALAHAFKSGAHVTVTLNGHHVDAELEKERHKNGGRLKSDPKK